MKMFTIAIAKLCRFLRRLTLKIEEVFLRRNTTSNKNSYIFQQKYFIVAYRAYR